MRHSLFSILVKKLASQASLSCVMIANFFRRTPMSAHPTRHRIKFSELALGQRFYDPISAEYFVKQSDSMAAMVTGIGDGTVPDEFEPDDIVGIDQ